MKLFTVLILALTSSVAHAQTFHYPVIKSNAPRLTDFVPAGWEIFNQATGDLNKDGLVDAALVLEKSTGNGKAHGQGSTDLGPPRMLVVLLKSPTNKGYAVSVQSNSFIPSHDDPETDDPFAGLAIARGVLKIGFQYNRSDSHDDISTSAYKFRYDGHQFVLIGADIDITGRMSFTFQKFSYNFLNRKGVFTTGPLGDEADETLTKTVRLPAPKTLTTFTKPGTWLISEDFSL